MKIKELALYDVNLNPLQRMKLGFVDDKIIESFDTFYLYEWSYSKTLAPVFDNMVEVETMKNPLATKQTIYDKVLDVIFTNISNLNFDTIKRYYDTLKIDYVPLDIYHMQETEDNNVDNVSTSNSNNKMSTNTNIKTSSKANNTKSTYGFNSSTAQPTNENSDDISSSSTGNANDNYSENVGSNTIDNTIVGKKIKNKKGNIGNIPTQDLIKGELDLRVMNKFYVFLSRLIDETLVLSIY